MSRQTPDAGPASDAVSGPVYCICRRSDDDENMILCEKCGTWFHLDCIHLKLPQAVLVKKYHCADCHRNYGLVSEWDVKCRLEDCFKKVEPNGKYCSPEHAVEFFSTRLSQVVGMKPSDAANLVKVSGSIEAFKNLGNSPPKADELLITPETVVHAPVPSAEEQAAVQAELAEIANRRAYFGKVLQFQRQNSENGSICGMDRHLLDNAYMLKHYNDEALDQSAICMQQDCEKHSEWPKRFKERFTIMSQRAQKRV